MATQTELCDDTPDVGRVERGARLHFSTPNSRRSQLTARKLSFTINSEALLEPPRFRTVHGIHAYRSAEKNGVWLTMSEAAMKLGVTNHPMRRLIKERVLTA
jgi:hypothetical protein